MRQMLQAATLQLLQGKQPEVAKQYLSRVFARLHKTLGETPQGVVWLPALAFSQWLEKQEQLPNSARQLLKDLDSELKKDRKSTRLNSSHVRISYAVFCLKKKM